MKYICVILLVIAIATGFMSYKIGNTKGYDNGRYSALLTSRSELDSKKTELTKEQEKYTQLLISNDKLVTDYNTLVNDYNSLRTSAMQYVGANTQARKPVTCYGYSYGVSSATATCY